MNRPLKTVALVAMLTLVSFCAGGCMLTALDAPSSSQQNGKTITLNVWHEWTSETDAMNIATSRAAAAYMERHPEVHIDINILENEAYKTKISTEFAGGAKGIDIFFWWGGGRGAKLARADKLLPVGDYITEDIEKLIRPNAEDLFICDGKLYALPLYSWMMVLYCNQELFQKVGATIPSTYEELIDACEKLSAGGIVPIAQGIKEQWQAAFVYEALALREVGAVKINEMFNGSGLFVDPGYLVAAERTQKLYTIGAFGPNPLELGNGDADTLFFTAKAAMRLQGNWFTESVSVDPNSQVDGKIVPVAIPLSSSGGGEPTDYCGGFIDTFFINKNTKHPDVAVDFYVELAQTLARERQESGQGFSGWLNDIDESRLTDLARKVAKLAEGTRLGVVAWDTGLDENIAAVHLDSVQALFTDVGDPETCVKEHQRILR